LMLPNLGTLMRFRYGPVLLLVALGLGALLHRLRASGRAGRAAGDAGTA
ncbi:MAG: hypothetical protein IRY94_21015, partial [Rhodospirillaceae bacterium]|nr:hypothetical protein [Rhodospirillaceae bacterium]